MRQHRVGLPHWLRNVAPGVNGCYVFSVNEIKSKRFEMVAAPEWLGRVDEWRRRQPDLPPRAEAIRRLVDRALKATSTAGDLPSE